ncbi:hypothetical protein QN277_004253 [Acacia crassicarpa]|uniref:Wall-associated receptor kinase C-terminal domain-containing protein n=1 Tax=Acacia crassicarpa TaxID=499986 RepID=A0AAE1J3Y1_9FABA|nr:hypothetical protein QN277_004253 [Acacia crassicarpa]
MDLQKLQCSSYSWFYSFNGEQSDPYEWNHGIALKYKFSVTDDYPISCIACERTNGVYGCTRDLNSFLCNCPGGIYTTKDCFFAPHYGVGFRNGVAWLWVFMAWSVVGFFL